MYYIANTGEWRFLSQDRSRKEVACISPSKGRDAIHFCSARQSALGRVRRGQRVLDAAETAAPHEIGVSRLALEYGVLPLIMLMRACFSLSISNTRMSAQREASLARWHEHLWLSSYLHNRKAETERRRGFRCQLKRAIAAAYCV